MARAKGHTGFNRVRPDVSGTREAPAGPVGNRTIGVPTLFGFAAHQNAPRCAHLISHHHLAPSAPTLSL
jgi:hypothetical protein